MGTRVPCALARFAAWGSGYPCVVHLLLTQIFRPCNNSTASACYP
jgi:hypothetical protein